MEIKFKDPVTKAIEDSISDGIEVSKEYLIQIQDRIKNIKDIHKAIQAINALNEEFFHFLQHLNLIIIDEMGESEKEELRKNIEHGKNI